MSVAGIFRAGLKVAEWATPHVKKWHHAKHLNRTEGHTPRNAAAREMLTPVIANLERTPNQTLRDAMEIMAVVEDESGRANDAARWREKASKLS